MRVIMRLEDRREKVGLRCCHGVLQIERVPRERLMMIMRRAWRQGAGEVTAGACPLPFTPALCGLPPSPPSFPYPVPACLV